MATREQADAITAAETAIRKLLLDLQEEIGPARIEDVRVDTRNFADFATEIFVRD